MLLGSNKIEGIWCNLMKTNENNMSPNRDVELPFYSITYDRPGLGSLSNGE